MSRNRRGLLCLIITVSYCILASFFPQPKAAFSSPPDFETIDSRTFKECINYRFIARITDNGGVMPFKKGEVICGTFAYDRRGTDKRPEAREHGVFVSSYNSLSLHYGDQYFRGTGDVLATVAVFEHAEHFGVVVHDLDLPKGWEMDHTIRSQSYGILFQNAPSKSIIANKELPYRLSLKDFVNTRELRLDFFHGVRFPGGKVEGRATVLTIVETLELIGPSLR
jgi:hypothetical protein